MIEEKLRIGNFTSSNIYKLMTFDRSGKNPGSSFYSYIQEKMFERKLGRSLEMGAKSQSMTWGKFLEKRVYDNLPMGYKMLNKATKQHPTIKSLVGTVDFVVPGVKVSELKCYEPKNFASYVSALMTRDAEKIKAEHPKEYWQIISNADINNVCIGEAIAYMPYESEMDDIRELMQDEDYLRQIGMTLKDLYYIHEKPNSELPVLPNDSKFSNLNVFEFEIPTEDVIFFTKRVLDAEKVLIS